jgi:hypothetical protein
MVNCNLMEMDVFMPQHTGYGRCNVQNEEEVFDAVRADPLISKMSGHM